MIRLFSILMLGGNVHFPKDTITYSNGEKMVVKKIEKDGTYVCHPVMDSTWTFHIRKEEIR